MNEVISMKSICNNLKVKKKVIFRKVMSAIFSCHLTITDLLTFCNITVQERDSHWFYF